MTHAITLAGESLIANKTANSETLTVDQFVFANISGLDHTADVDRSETLPTGDIVYQTGVSQQAYVSTSEVIYTCILDASIGDWDYNWIGLYSSADSVLVAIAYVPLQTKRRNDADYSGNNLTRNFGLVFDGAQTITNINVQAASWQADWTARLVAINERQEVANELAVGEYCFLNGAFLATENAGDLDFAAGDVYVKGVKTSTSGFSIVKPANSQTVWLEVVITPSANGIIISNTTQIAALGSPLSDSTDVDGTRHLFIEIANVESDGSVTDLRENHSIPSSLLELIESNTSNLQSQITSNDNDLTALSNTITANFNALDTQDTNNFNTLQAAMNSADSGLQGQIDSHTSSLTTHTSQISSLSIDHTNHANNTNNPHNVTKTQLGLSNVQNLTHEQLKSALAEEDYTLSEVYYSSTGETHVDSSWGDGLFFVQEYDASATPGEGQMFPINIDANVGAIQFASVTYSPMFPSHITGDLRRRFVYFHNATRRFLLRAEDYSGTREFLPITRIYKVVPS